MDITNMLAMGGVVLGLHFLGLLAPLWNYSTSTIAQWKGAEQVQQRLDPLLKDFQTPTGAAGTPQQGTPGSPQASTESTADADSIIQGQQGAGQAPVTTPTVPGSPSETPQTDSKSQLDPKTDWRGIQERDEFWIDTGN